MIDIRERDREHIDELLIHGYSISEICNELNMTKEYINSLLNEHFNIN